ncbi:MAG: hypothetical protein AABW88_01700 [Nanoarchaeota archaeon]
MQTKYMQPIRPNLHIYPISYENDVPIIDHGRIGEINLDNSTGMIFGFKITNTGKMASGSLRIAVANNWSDESYVDFENIPSGETKQGGVLLTTKKCHAWKLNNEWGYKQNKTDCKKSGDMIPLGNNPVKLRVYCTNCDPQTRYISLSVCFNNYKNQICSKGN